MLTAADTENRLRAAAASLQAGDAKAARATLEDVVSRGAENVQILLFLAHACRLTGDREAEESALDRLLASGGRSIRALIMKGDCRAWRGDQRAAVDFYKAALQAAAAATGTPPPELASELTRAADLIEKASRDYGDYIHRALAEDPSLSGAGRRFRRSVEIVTGEKEIFLQQPTSYYFPELPQIEFFEPSEFPWAAGVEAAFAGILDEMRSVLSDGKNLQPFIRSSRERPPQDSHGLMDNPDWSAFNLWEHGTAIEANIARCPATMAALRDVPMPRIPTVAPSVMFSVLQAGARIPPHHGMMNTRLVCHLPLVVPPGCRLRVGSEVREWTPGKLLIFDDSIEHEAWNDSGENRVVLIFEVWRPELSEDERSAVTALFAARERYGASAPTPGA